MSATIQRNATNDDFMSACATPDSEFFKLSSGELSEMSDRFDHVSDLLIEVISKLEMMELNSYRHGGQNVPTVEEINEIVERADHSHILLEEIRQAITHRCDNHQKSPLCAKSTAEISAEVML